MHEVDERMATRQWIVKKSQELSTCFIGSKPSYTKQILVKILLSVEPNVVVVETIACIVCIHAYMHGRHAIIRACISAPQKHRCPARPCPGSTSLMPAQTSTLLNTNPIEHQSYWTSTLFTDCSVYLMYWLSCWSRIDCYADCQCAKLTCCDNIRQELNDATHVASVVVCNAV